MKKHTIRQFGVAEEYFSREFVVELPDDVDPASLDEDALGRLADEGEVEWTNDDSWDVMTLSDHEVLGDSEPTDRLPILKISSERTAPDSPVRCETPKGSTYAAAKETLPHSTHTNSTRQWPSHWGERLVTIGSWTISKAEDGLRLWQLSYGCQHGVGPVTDGDLEELQACIRRTLALLSEEMNHG